MCLICLAATAHLTHPQLEGAVLSRLIIRSYKNGYSSSLYSFPIPLGPVDSLSTPFEALLTHPPHRSDSHNQPRQTNSKPLWIFV